jgi:hypothetical protein
MTGTFKDQQGKKLFEREISQEGKQDIYEKYWQHDILEFDGNQYTIKRFIVHKNQDNTDASMEITVIFVGSLNYDMYC